MSHPDSLPSMSCLTQAFRQHLAGRARAPETVERFAATVAALLAAYGLSDDRSAPLAALTPSDVGTFSLIAPHRRPSATSSSPRSARCSSRGLSAKVWSRRPARSSSGRRSWSTRANPCRSTRCFAWWRRSTTAPKKLKLRDVALVQVFFHCALRVSEVVSIDLDQVDVENHLIRNVVTKGDGRLTVVINDVVAEALERYAERRGTPSHRG